MPSPEIRFGLTRFVGLEALRSQRLPITLLVLAKAFLTFSLAAAVWLMVLKPELLHSDFYVRLLSVIAAK